MNRSLAVLVLFLFSLCASAAAQEKTAPIQKTVERLPVSYGLVVDNSGSFRMLLDRVITAASEVIESNGADDEAFLVTFVDTQKIVLRQEFTDSKADLRDAAENMFIEGGPTAILDAIKSAADYLSQNARKDDQRTRALILITDGDERGSETKIEDVLKILKDQKIRVLVIAMSPEKVFTKIPERLAKETGGVMIMPKTKVDLASAVKDIVTAMRTK